jgi:teichuronic acid biosynthesis glycosyltransferase TuaC
MKNNKVLWVHNFQNKVGKGGVWMFNQHEYLKSEVDLYFLNNLRNPIQFLKHIFYLFKISKNYAVVHAQYGSAVGFIVSLLPCKRILTLRGSDWYKAPSKKMTDKIRISIGHFFTKISIDKFDEIIVVSNRMKNELLQLNDNLTVHVIPTPIDLEKFHPIPNTNDSAVKKILFATVTKDNPTKRYDLAMKTVELLQARMPNVELSLMNNISHNKVNEFINQTDVLLLTSTHEGWPNVVKESLACNVPFVSTDVSDLAEIASQTQNCFVVNDSATTLAAALEKALKVGKNQDLRKFVAPFEMQEGVKKFKELYLKYIS